VIATRTPFASRWLTVVISDNSRSSTFLNTLLVSPSKDDARALFHEPREGSLALSALPPSGEIINKVIAMSQNNDQASYIAAPLSSTGLVLTRPEPWLKHHILSPLNGIQRAELEEQWSKDTGSLQEPSELALMAQVAGFNGVVYLAHPTQTALQAHTMLCKTFENSPLVDLADDFLVVVVVLSSDELAVIKGAFYSEPLAASGSIPSHDVYISIAPTSELALRPTASAVSEYTFLHEMLAGEIKRVVIHGKCIRLCCTDLSEKCD